MNFIDWLKGLFGGGNEQAEQKLLSGTVDERLSKTKEELIAELDEALGMVTKLKRAYADELNGKTAFQKRIRKEQERAIDEGRAKILGELLDVSDELDRALDALKQDHSGDQANNALVQGVGMVRDSMKRRLEMLGVTRMELVGKPFDPNTAEAMEIVQVAQAEQDSVVIQELRPGFALKGMVIREARVTVGKWITPPPSTVQMTPSEKSESPRETPLESMPSDVAENAVSSAEIDAPEAAPTSEATANSTATPEAKLPSAEASES